MRFLTQLFWIYLMVLITLVLGACAITPGESEPEPGSGSMRVQQTAISPPVSPVPMLTNAVVSAATGILTAEDPITPAALTQEQEIWAQTECLGIYSLRDFLETFPEGGLAQEARRYLAFLDGISAVASGKQAPGFVIRFEQLGPRWQTWQERRPEAGIIGYFKNKDTVNLLTLFPGCFDFSLDEQGLPIAPTGHSSIIAFQTGEQPFEFLNDITIETDPDEIVYFAVVEGIGLVHLEGRGKVTMPDGLAVKLD